MTNRDRFEELDAFRGLAALSVVLFHYTTRYEQVYHHTSAPLFSIPWGHYGVQFFFIISGFVIFMTLERCKSWKDFVISRFSRLFPAYWAAVCLTYLVGTLAPLPDQHYEPVQLAVNLTMLQSFFYIPAIDGVYWSLAWELNFYIIMLGFFVLSLLSNFEKLAPLWLLAMLGNSVAMHAGVDIPWKVQTFLVLKYTNLFIAGIIFYQLKTNGYTKYRLALLGACLLAEFYSGGLESGWFMLGFITLFFLALHSKLAFLKSAPLLWLGGISYTLYLVHQMIGFRIIFSLESVGLSATQAILISLAISLFIATLITRTIERPMLKLIRQRRMKNTLKPT